MYTRGHTAAGFPGFVVSDAPGTKSASSGPKQLPYRALRYESALPVAEPTLSTCICTSPPCFARSASTRSSGSGAVSIRSEFDLSEIGGQPYNSICSPSPKQTKHCSLLQSAGTDQTGKTCDGYAPDNNVCENHGIIDKLNFETMRCSFDSKLYAVEKNILEHVQLQCNGWRTNFDSRLRALEEYIQKDANKVLRKIHKIDYCLASLQECCELKYQQHVDLNDEVSSIEALVSDCEESLRRPSRKADHQHNVEPKVQSKVLTQQEENFVEQGSHQKQELAKSQQLASILQDIETRLSNMNEQVPASSRAERVDSTSKKSTDGNTMSFSREALESFSAAHQPDAGPLVCNQHSALSKKSARVEPHEVHKTLLGITNCQHQEDANAQVEHEHSQMQFMLAEATRCLEQVVPVKEGHLSNECCTTVEE